MNGQRTWQWAVLSGAALGAAAGYLLGTPGGRRFCDACVGALDDFSDECERFCQALVRAQVAATDSGRVFEWWREESRLFTPASARNGPPTD
jgi:hypothetical protein